MILHVLVDRRDLLLLRQRRRGGGAATAAVSAGAAGGGRAFRRAGASRRRRCRPEAGSPPSFSSSAFLAASKLSIAAVAPLTTRTFASGASARFTPAAYQSTSFVQFASKFGLKRMRGSEIAERRRRLRLHRLQVLVLPDPLDISPSRRKSSSGRGRRCIQLLEEFCHQAFCIIALREL
jgi:hypothetical protein